ncbi:hypothetical protein EIP86_002762 [Pleurotus ostreatoroseus]|nr:hypothetical protein EIP86_002762 [Pleurotus ostreatoroseus]
MADNQRDVGQKSTPSAVRRRVSPSRFIVFNLLVAGVCLCVVYGMKRLHADVEPRGRVVELDTADPERVWTQVPPSPVDNLVWIPCYTGLVCAKMTVPLDYADPKGPSAVIAMVKSPAKVPQSSDKYRGPILFNPGGPGGSGVDAVVKRAGQMRALLGDEYDFVGFDPRGVGRTIPNVQIFTDDAEDTRWRLQMLGLPLPNSTQDAVSRIHAQYQVYGKLAELRTMDASPYVSTALVCRDMVNMMKAHGWEKIQYWGFSYGTVLGATFAAMFPDKVERLVIDGVEDSEDYYAMDTDKVLDMFFEECAAAGPELCALHDASASRIKARFMNLLTSLKTAPMAVTATSLLASPTEYGIVDYALVLRIVFEFSYGPYPAAARTVTPADLASALAAAEKGDPVPLWDLDKNNTVEFKCQCSPSPKPPASVGMDATAAISCTDGDPVEDTTEELGKLWDRVLGDSIFGALWGGRARCSGWKIRSVERFNGPFVGNTSYPILLIGNTADPVTPVVNAHKMSKGYNNSVVLTQHSAGHCSLSATSACTARAVRAYFRDGKLPEPDTVCEVESEMFPKGDSAYHTEAWLSDVPEDEREAVKAWRELSETFEPPMYGWGM